MSGGHEVGRDDDDVIASINIIPFVDIVLVLLIIFMVTSSVIVRSALRVDLPKAAAAGESVSATVNVVLTAQGVLYLDGAKTTKLGLAKQLRERVGSDPKTQAVISADQGLAYGEVVGLIDLIKQVGISTFALSIERMAKAGSGAEAGSGEAPRF